MMRPRRDAAPSTDDTRVSEATDRLMARLSDDAPPSPDTLRLAARDAEQHLRRIVLDSDLAGDDPEAPLALSEWIQRHPLPLPAPHFRERINGPKLALATVIGTLGGGLLVSGIFKLLLPGPDGTADINLGYLIGSLLGAALTVLAVWHSSENRAVRRTLQGLLGVATIGEAWMLIANLSGLGGLWALLGRRAGGSLFKRLGAYLTVFFILRLGVKTPVFDRDAYRRNAAAAVEQWQERLRLALAAHHPSPETTADAGRNPLKVLGPALHKLRRSSREALPAAVDELLMRARTLGIEGLDGDGPADGDGGPPREFVWSDDDGDRFHCIGVIEAGDTVFVEDEPVIQAGEVIEKGVVRKRRGRRP